MARQFQREAWRESTGLTLPPRGPRRRSWSFFKFSAFLPLREGSAGLWPPRQLDYTRDRGSPMACGQLDLFRLSGQPPGCPCPRWSGGDPADSSAIADYLGAQKAGGCGRCSPAIRSNVARVFLLLRTDWARYGPWPPAGPKIATPTPCSRPPAKQNGLICAAALLARRQTRGPLAPPLVAGLPGGTAHCLGD